MSKRKENTVCVDGMQKFNSIGKTSNTLFNLIFIVLSLIAVLPVVFVFIISISKESSIQEFGYRIIPKEFSGAGYAYLAEQGQLILRTLGNSLFVTIVGTGLGVLLTTLMGYVISRQGYKLQKFFTWIVFIPMVFNGGMVAQYVVNTQMLGLKNSIWVLILPIAVSSFNVIVAKTFFRMTIPDSLIESAKMDGASQWRIFFQMVLPLSTPVIATIGLLLSFAYWNDWWLSLMYIDDVKMYTLQGFLNKLMGDIAILARLATTGSVTQAEILRNMPQESARMAIAMVIVVPIGCAYPFFQRYFISGLTVGAVKG
jgi:putative aldouronate transport system permease protein